MSKICYTFYVCLFSLSMASCAYSCPKICFCPREEEAICEFGPEQNEIPKLLPIKLKNLTIEGGKFAEIRGEDFDNFVNLEKLQLTRNGIYKIYPYTFSNLKKLRVLIIKYNPLETLDEYSLGGITNLKELILTHNQIRYIRKHAFFNTTNIQQFDLRHNPMERVESYAFSNVNDVGYLHLPSHLHYIEPDAFNNMNKVHFIELRHWNALDSQGKGVAAHTFRGLSHVTSILIENSQLGIVRSHAFGGLSEIGILSIQNCQIKHLKRLSFINSTIKTLDLGSNLIWTMDRKTMTDLYLKKDLMTVKFSGNSMDCTCYNVWLLNEIRDVCKENLNKNYCNVPDKFIKKSLSSVDDSYIKECQTVSFDDDISFNNTEQKDSGAMKFEQNYALVFFVSFYLITVSSFLW